MKNAGAKSGSSKAQSQQVNKEGKSKVLDYILVAFFALLWLVAFIYRNYPGLLGIKPKTVAESLQKDEDFTLEYK